MSLNNQPSMTRPTAIDLNHDEYNRGLRCNVDLHCGVVVIATD